MTASVETAIFSGESESPASFYERNREGLAELFTEMELPAAAAYDLNAAVELTQPWVKGDYSRPDFLFAIPEEKKATLFRLYDSFGLRQAHELPDGHYDELVVMGAVMNGLNNRLNFTADSASRPGVNTDLITMLSGQRPPFPESEKEDIEATAIDLIQEGPQTPWISSAIDDRSNLRWETDLMRLSATSQMGHMAVKGIDLRLGNADPIQAYTMQWQAVPTRLINALAVPRIKGDPRPNTESTIREWLREYPPVENARVAFIAANPHLERMAKSARFVLNQEGREDITLVPAGPAATPNISHPHYLAETAQNLFEDRRAQTS